MRLALGVEYDGRGFCGWQAQKSDVRTVQEHLEAALSQVANHPVQVICAGRTDTGVHALEQVVHFDTEASRAERSWLLGSHVHLPDDVSLRWIKPVSDDFHARFSAQARCYRYLILNRGVRSGLWAGRATWIHRPLDVERMRQAGQALVGRHDFTSYRAVACQANSPVRTLSHLRVERFGELILLSLRANAFLHHMVRNIAGVLIAIGKGEADVEWAAEVLAARDRTLGGVTAVPDGLYFERAEYPDEFELPYLSATLPGMGGALRALV